MKLATVAQAKKIDELSQIQYGLSAEALMEAAGESVALELEQNYCEQLRRGPCLVVCGCGNNGGDGLVVARILKTKGHDVRVAIVDPEARRSPLFSLQLERAKKVNINCDAVLADIDSATIVVDAIFGIGLDRPVVAPVATWIEAINAAKKVVISVDIPSGLNGDTGTIHGHAVTATETLTFGIAKAGCFVADGPLCTGKLKVLNIGFPRELVEITANSIRVFTESEAASALPHRAERGNKSNFGRVLVLAGSKDFWGAGILVCHAAYRVGAGYVTWASFDTPIEAIKDIPEALTRKIDDKLYEEHFDAVVVGPGLGVSDATAGVLSTLKQKKINRVVVDADAITVAAKFDLWPLPKDWIVTPHAGELARVLGGSAQQMDGDRFQAVNQAVSKTGCQILFKGFRTVLCDGEETIVIPVGNSALAKAGSGDVLSGIIGGLMAQGLDTKIAAATAAYLHGRFSEDFVNKGRHVNSLMPSDIYNFLPQLMGKIAGTKNS